MIVNPVPEGWEIVFHRAHALLAAQIALQWQNKERVEKVAETIAAIAQHDDLEREFEGDHLTDAGAPCDFTIRPQDPETEIPRWQEMVQGAVYRSRWVGLLSAHHVCFLNRDKRNSSPELERFLGGLESQMEEWRKQLKVSKKDLDASYAFMQWCDRLSLILVQKKLPEAERWLEVSAGPDGIVYSVRIHETAPVIEVKPWPFADREFTIEADYRTLRQLAFSDNDALVQAMREAPVSARTWTFRRGKA